MLIFKQATTQVFEEKCRRSSLSGRTSHWELLNMYFETGDQELQHMRLGCSRNSQRNEGGAYQF
ncbi:hypothetical protein GJU40_02950 [Bacillus lacus]|uniref:Uncharacterized protein n=1 Tax=Metabacillus lacus TaxID=1983721 RepID=A0A7X2IXV9_9BACI|nr:hypothetical protein [Metabacillus lacus]MRX71128.1 hypothetical protein [Metabacillus lacus]